MDLIDNIADTINDFKKLTNNQLLLNYTKIPLQMIIIEYIYLKCHDCYKLLVKEDEKYKCRGCDVFRCKFHHFVCGIKKMCIVCQDKKEIPAYKIYNDVYTCIQCKNSAEYGFVDNVILCRECAFKSSDSKYIKIISFDIYCQKDKCCGTGWFINKSDKKKYCLKHKDDDCEHYIIEIEKD